MGQEILYCYKCNTRVLGADLEKGAAYEVANRVSCGDCAGELLTSLSDRDRELLLSKMVKAPTRPEPKSGSLPAKTPRSGSRIATTSDAPSWARNPIVLLAMAGGALVVVAGGWALMSGEPKRRLEPTVTLNSPPPPPPPKRDSPAPEKALAKEYGRLDQQVREHCQKEEFRKAMDLLAEARKHDQGSDWKSLIDRKVQETLEAAKTLFATLRDRAVDARRRSAESEVKAVEDRIAKWGLDDFRDRFREALAAAAEFRPANPSNGLICMEAEHFNANVEQGGARWVLVAAPPGFSGEGAMEATPNAGLTVTTEYAAKCPRLDYRVNFPKAGTWYVWVRAYGATEADNSFHAGLDGVETASAANIGYPIKKWVWSGKMLDGKRAALAVPSAGAHTVNIWMREDGSILDRVLLTPDAKFTPADAGPAESPH